MEGIEAVYDLDKPKFAQLLIEAGIDIRTNDAQIQSAEVKVEVEDGELEYVFSTRLNATESAQFNQMVDDIK